MQLLDFQFICYTSTKLQILIECYTLYILLTSGTCDHGRTFYLHGLLSKCCCLSAAAVGDHPEDGGAAGGGRGQAAGVWGSKQQ